jgi:hypothetical protein
MFYVAKKHKEKRVNFAIFCATFVLSSVFDKKKDLMSRKAPLPSPSLADVDCGPSSKVANWTQSQEWITPGKFISKLADCRSEPFMIYDL